MRDEPLRRLKAPFLLPTLVKVGGKVSEAGLKALAKRALYPPALWPEELDDSTSIRGHLEVTFKGDFPGGGTPMLYLRVKAGAKAPVCAIHGELLPLGHNAGKRGWQPFLLSLGETTFTPPETIIQTDINAPVSRMLLGWE